MCESLCKLCLFCGKARRAARTEFMRAHRVQKFLKIEQVIHCIRFNEGYISTCHAARAPLTRLLNPGANPGGGTCPPTLTGGANAPMPPSSEPLDCAAPK